MSGLVTVSSGKVTIRDSKTGGTLYHIMTKGTGTVTLESGTLKSRSGVTNGTFHVEGGTITGIDLTGGQLNWNSDKVEENAFCRYWRRNGDPCSAEAARPLSEAVLIASYFIIDLWVNMHKNNVVILCILY